MTLQLALVFYTSLFVLRYDYRNSEISHLWFELQLQRAIAGASIAYTQRKERHANAPNSVTTNVKSLAPTSFP